MPLNYSLQQTSYFEINFNIMDYFKSKGINLVEILLVGSRVKNFEKKVDSDFDSIILLKENLSLDNLKTLKDELNLLISFWNPSIRYHFKLFSIHEFFRAKKYDPFRLFEIQQNYISTINSTIINVGPLKLDIKGMINSILIQKVYGQFNNCNYKIKGRFTRNNCILSQHGQLIIEKKNYDEIFSGMDNLYAHFEIAKKEPQKWPSFLEKYFDRFRHEYINKSFEYYRKISSKTLISN